MLTLDSIVHIHPAHHAMHALRSLAIVAIGALPRKRKCVVCGAPFYRSRPNEVTCSPACKRDRRLQTKRQWKRRRAAQAKD